MKLKNYYPISLLLISFLLMICSPIEAAQELNTKSVKLEKKELIEKTTKEAINDKIIKNGKSALVAGIFSISLLIIGVFLLATAAANIGFVFLLAAIAAVIGDIFGIKTLRQINKLENKEEYKHSRKLAITGLTLSLLAGLIPLLFLLLVIISV